MEVEDMINKVHNKNFLNNNLPDKCAKLIIADPPYFEVKGHFDFVWESFNDYLNDVELWALECKRILADNGTLFWWGDAKKIAYTQIILDKHFKLENNIIWRKMDSIQYQFYSVDNSRKFTTHNERLLMYSNEVNKTGLEMVKDVMPNPFSLYLKSEFEKAGVSNKEISKLFPSKNGNLTGCVSNWLNGENIITEQQYLKIREHLGQNYLRREYEDLRRCFYNPSKLDEVFEFSQESHITRKYKHDTKKPESLTSSLILTCSRENDLVIIPFAGSGTECAMSARYNRLFIGFDIEEKYVKMSNQRCKTELSKKQIFC